MKKIYTDTDGREYTRSRWIKIRHNYNVRKNNSLYYYVTDENGESTQSKRYNGKETLLDYFKYQRKNYAIGQFFRLSYPIFINESDGKITFLSGYDCENYYNPILIELSDCCEYVRIYEEKRKSY